MHAAWALFPWRGTGKWEQIMMLPGTCVIYPSIEDAIDSPFPVRSCFFCMMLLHKISGIIHDCHFKSNQIDNLPIA